MLPETHGTNASYVAGCRCDDCRSATRRYHKALVLDHHRGVRRLVDATGTRRRIESLGALGWTGAQIGVRLGISGEHVRQLRSQKLVTREMGRRMSAVFEELSMRLPPETTRAERHNASRQRNKARAAGWLPPLAWDDIDDPNEQPAIKVANGDHPEDRIDHAVVWRVISGDRRPRRLTRAEAAEVVNTWRRQGLSEWEIEERGFAPSRYPEKGPKMRPDLRRCVPTWDAKRALSWDNENEPSRGVGAPQPGSNHPPFSNNERGCW